ncbi:hypothetical protein LTR67_006854 [Exophiala xenobiotica]
MTNTEPTLGVSNDVPNPELPYQPYMDVKPPAEAALSETNGAPLTEREVEALEKREREDRESTPEPENFAIAFPDHLPTPPFLHVEGVPNFRDLGGYACQPPSSSASTSTTDSDSGTSSQQQPGTTTATTATYILRKGLLYRCAHPTHLTAQGASYLTQTLGVRDMYDLRSQPEISRLAATVASSGKTIYPLADPETGCLDHVTGLTRHFTPVYQSEDYGPVALAKKLGWYTAAHAHDEGVGFAYSEGFVKAYRDIAVHGARPAYEKIFRQLLDRPGEPLVFHCTAGKDRTGVFGALVGKLVGVPEDMICWEYALTEPGLGEWRAQFIERICASGLGGGGGKASTSPGAGQQQQRPQISREEAARICGSRAGNMRAFLKVVLEKELGGVERYLVERCGLTMDEVTRLRDSLIVKVHDEGQVVKKCEIKGWTAEGGVQDLKN